MERFSLKTDLRHAIERGELELLLPAAGARERTAASWAPRRCSAGTTASAGMVMPDVFIPLAEETGLILPIGEWVLAEACRQSKAWQDSGFEPIRMAVNLSARQLAHSGSLIDVGPGGAGRQRHGRRPPRARDHREHRDAQPGLRDAHAARAARTWASASPSTTSAPATRRSSTCAGSPSTR